MIQKETDKHIIKIPVSPSLCEIQKIALCGIADLLRKELWIWLVWFDLVLFFCLMAYQPVKEGKKLKVKWKIEFKKKQLAI